MPHTLLKNIFKKKLDERWLHIGPGNFHKAHQAYYLDKNNKSNNTNISILGFEINSKTMIDKRLIKKNYT